MADSTPSPLSLRGPEGESPSLLHVRALAVTYRLALHEIARLYAIAGDRKPVAAEYGPASYRWEQLERDLSAWSYQLRHALDVLSAHFSPDVGDALESAGFDPIGWDDDFGDEDDGPDDDGPDDEDDGPPPTSGADGPLVLAGGPPDRSWFYN